MRVLIVQSNEQLGELWKAHLVRLGASVRIAEDGETAVEILQETQFDAIVLDLVLESGAALSVADMISFRQPAANVIFVTDTSFFSDGSIFAHSGNARALIESKTPPVDLAEIVFHFGQSPSSDHGARPSLKQGLSG